MNLELRLELGGRWNQLLRRIDSGRCPIVGEEVIYTKVDGTRMKTIVREVYTEYEDKVVREPDESMDEGKMVTTETVIVMLVELDE